MRPVVTKALVQLAHHLLASVADPPRPPQATGDGIVARGMADLFDSVPEVIQSGPLQQAAAANIALRRGRLLRQEAELRAEGRPEHEVAQRMLELTVDARAEVLKLLDDLADRQHSTTKKIIDSFGR